MAEAIVRGALLRIAQNAIGFGGFFEFFLGCVIAGIAIGMILHRELAIGGLQRPDRRSPAPRQGFRNNLVWSRHSFRLRLNRHFHHRRPQQPALEIVPALKFIQHRVVRRFFGLHHVDRMMNMRIESLPLRIQSAPGRVSSGRLEAIVNQLMPG